MMKQGLFSAAIVICIFLNGCHSSKISDMEQRLSKLEKQPPKTDDATQRILDILVGAPALGSMEPDKSDAVIALALFGKTEAIPEIIRFAKVTDNNSFRFTCHNALGWMGDPEAIPYLEYAMKNDSWYLSRRAAAVALERITGDKYLTVENGFETPEMVSARLAREGAEADRIHEKLSSGRFEADSVKTNVISQTNNPESVQQPGAE